jgi:tRNA pseudouridine55 synthase
VEVERKPRPVIFSKLEISPGEPGAVKLLVECSGGAYIRTLCHDIGEKLGCGAVLSELRRIKSGPFDISQAVTIENVKPENILPADSLFYEYPAYTATAEQEKRIRNGADFEIELFGKYRVYAQDGEFLMLGNAKDGKMELIKSFYGV